MELIVPIGYYKAFFIPIIKREIMVRLIYYQFNYRRREWSGAFPVLFSAGVVVGTCFTILFNVLGNTELFSRVIPAPLFIAPVFFGGLTLFFLISTLIKLLLNIFKDEYRLWYILGADRRQLSMLVGGQFAIVTLISSFIGSFISILSAKSYYYLIQGRVGVDYFPSISIQFNLLAVFLTIIFLTLVCFASATYNAYKLLDENIIFEEDKGEKKIYKFTKFGIFGINVFLWLSLVVGSVVVPYLDLPGGVSYKLSFMSSAIFYLLVIHILFLKYLSPWIELRIVQFLFKKVKGFATVLSKWSVIEKKYFLSSVTISMVTAITLITGLLLISNNGIRNSVEQNKEIYISFLFYLVAPLFIIVANIISVTIISSRQDETLSFQLETLGVSRLQKIKIRFYESIIYSVIILIVSLIFNLIITLLVINIVNYTDLLTLNIWYIFSPALLISIAFCVVIFITKIAVEFYSNSKPDQNI
ncbi:TPA: FtsX-like permease family protein [Streptococcus equi subsp. zooepidemicus]|nr:FtsX-like permease family protein [Streptococcus equi subsp. zooepidemicus]